MKAMILAAGLGERMRPLTEQIPKPLLDAGKHKLIEYNLFALQKAGIKKVVINVSYHGEQVIQYLGDGSRYHLEITYSIEPNKPLGTGGGIYQALSLLGNESFILLSSDIYCDYALQQLPSLNKSDAHLVLVNNPSFHQEGDFALLENHRLSLEGVKYTYACIAVLDPDLFKDCLPGTFSLAPLLIKAIKAGRATGELYCGVWSNIGTSAQLASLAEKLSASSSRV